MGLFDYYLKEKKEVTEKEKENENKKEIEMQRNFINHDFFSI